MGLYEDLVPPVDAPKIDWDAIAQHFGWFVRLADCPQDAVHHGEGDVQTHTKMVVEELVESDAWLGLAEEDRRVLFWAALLHDVAKPDTTRLEANGRITAVGHSRRGQLMARQLLWRLESPFAERERICQLVRHHMVPFFLIGRDAPERLAHLISYQTRCDLLAIHAEADARGRIAPDVDRLLDNIALFRELCRGEACFDQPRPFASDHTRFLYFRKKDRSPDYVAYDDWSNTVILMSGMPGSGKDTWVRRSASDCSVVSLDEIRSGLGLSPSDTSGPVISKAREQARRHLRAGEPFVWNATNLSRQLRGSLIDLCAGYGAKVRIVYLETTADELARRNRERSAPVPDKAIERMLWRWEIPDLTECHELDIVLT
ncbi:MAG: AAA family ATPase [Hyphomicrobiaceae bacterium]